ncbi:hypothetical protein VNO77_22904 [Canavalia gladiata]|uniref:Uncharacterized protein n=1 Tax=Canavalia gladiata TaxID=3824 RepID=A0AAN9L3M0_CANGL
MKFDLHALPKHLLAIACISKHQTPYKDLIGVSTYASCHHLFGQELICQVPRLYGGAVLDFQVIPCHHAGILWAVTRYPNKTSLRDNNKSVSKSSLKKNHCLEFNA